MFHLFLIFLEIKYVYESEYYYKKHKGGSMRATILS